MKKVVVILAGGSGLRMSSDIPKQFMLIKDLPILMHTINAFFLFDSSMELRLVLPEDQMEEWERLCEEYKFKPKCKIFPGGETRFHSVKNGIEGISE